MFHLITCIMKYNENFMKFFSFKTKFIGVAYIPANDINENAYKVLKFCRSIDSSVCAHQRTGIEDLNCVYRNLIFAPYSCSNEMYDQPIVLSFDFRNSTVKIGGNVFSVKTDNEFSIRIKRKTIFSRNGIYGFYQTVLNFMQSDSPFNSWFYTGLRKLSL